MAEPARRVRFGPRERRGLIAGWRAPQLALVALGLLSAIALARMLPASLALVASPALATAAVAAASVPWRGRTAEQWVPVVVAFALRRLRRRGNLELPVGSAERRRPSRAVSGAIDTAGLRLGRSMVGPAGELGFILDERARRVSIGAALRSPGGVLAPGGADPNAVVAWANLLRSVSRAGSPVARLQWIAWCRPAAQGRDLSRGAILVVSVGYGRRRGRAEAVALALHELLAGTRLLAEAGVELGEPFDQAGLAAACTLDVGDRAYPWPMAVHEAWDHVVLDASTVVVSWVEEWPRVDRELGFLSALLLVAPSTRISVTFEPVGPAEAARRLEQERTSSLADEEIKRRGGFLSTMRRQRELEGALNREAELAEGEGLLSFTGFTAAIGRDLDEARALQGNLEEAAARGGLALRLLHGEQGPALARLLPLGRSARS